MQHTFASPNRCIFALSVYAICISVRLQACSAPTYVLCKHSRSTFPAGSTFPLRALRMHPAHRSLSSHACALPSLRIRVPSHLFVCMHACRRTALIACLWPLTIFLSARPDLLSVESIWRVWNGPSGTAPVPFDALTGRLRRAAAARDCESERGRDCERERRRGRGGGPHIGLRIGPCPQRRPHAKEGSDGSVAPASLEHLHPLAAECPRWLGDTERGRERERE